MSLVSKFRHFSLSLYIPTEMWVSLPFPLPLGISRSPYEHPSLIIGSLKYVVGLLVLAVKSVKTNSPLMKSSEDLVSLYSYSES